MKENVWYGHSGDQCPVHPDATVMVVLRIDVGSHSLMSPVRAGNMRWTQTGGAGDIVLFKTLEVKKEFVVGKWYKPVASAPYDAKWVKCIAVDGEMGWLTQSNVHPAIRRNTSYVDWSVAPKDEHP